MKATIIRLPAIGWCVRGGAPFAHYLGWYRGRPWSACGSVQRHELYRPQALAPLQKEKPRCAVCEAQLTTRKASAR